MSESVVIQLPARNTVRGVIASNVRAEAARGGLSASALGRAIGMSQTQISKRLNGSVDFTAPELWDIAALLGVSVQDLYDTKKPRPVGPDGANVEPPVGIEPTTYSLRVNASVVDLGAERQRRATA